MVTMVIKIIFIYSFSWVLDRLMTIEKSAPASLEWYE